MPVTNAQGEQYRFDLGGFTGNGTRVGCSSVDGMPRTLVGLNVVTDAGGSPVRVTATQVLVNGTTARNGATQTFPVGDPQSVLVRPARGLSCGDATVDTSGVVASQR